MKKNPHAVALGRLGGAAKSAAQARASRRNGKLGGFPKGKKRAKGHGRAGALARWAKAKLATAA